MVSATAIRNVIICLSTAAMPAANGAAPTAGIQPAALSFAAQSVGTLSASQLIRISNGGTAPMQLTALTLSGADAALFLKTDDCAASLAPGQSCVAAIAFKPDSAGTKSATFTVNVDATSSSSIAVTGLATLPPEFPPYPVTDPRVILDIGIASLKPRNTWTALPAGYQLARVGGESPGILSDTGGFTPNSGGYIFNYSAEPILRSSQGTVYMRLQRSALAADDSADVGAAFYDSTGNTTGGYGADSATAFTLFDGTDNIIQWVMSAQPGSNLQILDAGAWLYPGGRYANSHGPAELDSSAMDLVLTWNGAAYWAFLDGTPVAFGSLPTALPASGQFSQIVIGGYLGGAGNVGKPLGPFTIQRFQLSSAFSPPPTLQGTPLIGFYGDSFVVQGGGVTGNVAGPPGSPSVAQVNAVQTQLNPSTSPNGTAGTIGQDGFISRAQAIALKQFGGYLQMYTAAESGHGWAYTGMGGTTAANTPAIDDFDLGKTGNSDALNAAQPAYVFAFGSVNDVNNGVPADIVGDTKAHFDYWADHNPNLKKIYYVETLSWELATGACTSRGGPAGWKAEMARQRGLLRAALSAGYSAGKRAVPVTYIRTYETWVQGPDSARFLIASNPDNHSESSNTGTSPNGHPDAEGNIQMVDAYVWPYLQWLIR